MRALKKDGRYRTQSVERAEFVLLDFLYQGLFSGVSSDRLRPEAEAGFAKEKPVFLYPHSFSPVLPYDLESGRPPRDVDAFFVPSEGFAEVLRLINYPTQAIEVVGWSYSDIKPFRPAGEKPNVVFAPLHPTNRSLPECEVEINKAAYKLLLQMLQAGEIASLTVRHYKTLEMNGLWEAPNVHYVNCLLNGSMSDAERSDVVVSAGTYAYMAVALGIPTVMMGQDICPHNSPQSDGELIYVLNWEAYRDFLRFPWSFETSTSLNDAVNVLRQASAEEPASWKRTFIGTPFDSQLFMERLEAQL